MTKWPTDTCACGATKMARSSVCRSCFMRWPDRFWAKVDTAGECWVWTAQIDANGYGIVSFGGKSNKAHRVSWEMEHGPIPDGLTIDHLCRVRPCVKPAHMELVTSSENVLRGEGAFVRNSRKTHCIRGHEFTPENIYLARNGGRNCKECRRINARACYHRQKVSK